MKDKSLLLIVGVVAAACAWVFFKVSGEDAFSILNVFIIISLFFENESLRKQLNELRKATSGDGNP